MRIGLQQFLVAACLLAAGSAVAATTADVKGKVFVSHGGGFAPAANGDTLSAGDQVMTRALSTVTIDYSDGCKVKVEPSQTATVAPTSPCKAGIIPGELAQEAGSSFQVAPVAIGGGLVVLGVGAVVLTNSSSDKPTSP